MNVSEWANWRAVDAMAACVPPERQQDATIDLLHSARSLGFMVGVSLGGALYDLRPQAPSLAVGAVSALKAVFVMVVTTTSSSSRGNAAGA